MCACVCVTRMKTPAAPVSSPGKWVSRDEFDGRKSFGQFVCFNCNSQWISAHAYRRFKQGCTRCHKYYFPRLMWKNYGRRESEDDDDDGEVMNLDREKPHRRDLCQACKAGVCEL